MLFRTHVAFSVFVYLVLMKWIAMPWYVGIFVVVATIFVDVDAKNSRMGRRWYLRPFQWIVKHRGMVHSLIFGLFLSVLIAAVSNWAGFGFFVGYMSHLFLDCFTYSGVALFWPFKWKVKGFVRSGGVFEEVVFVLFLLADFGLVILYYINAY